MSVRQIIKTLIARGYRVTYRERKDGGVRITKINGTSFSGSEGNVEARILSGETLSERRYKQLHSKALLTEKGSWGGNRRRGKVSLDEEIAKQLRRVQRLWRRRDIKAGYPSMKNVRFVTREYGKEEALRRLAQNERYARGYAYDENIDGLLAILNEYRKKATPVEVENLDKCIQIVKDIRETLKDEILYKMKEAAYNWAKGSYDSKELVRLYEELKELNNKK